MKTTFRVEKPGDIVLTLSMTMTLEHWIALREQIKSFGWRACDLRYAINSVVTQAQQQFWPPSKEEQTDAV